MSDSKPPAEPAAASAASNGPNPSPAASSSTTASNPSTPKNSASASSSSYKPPERNPALRMLGLPGLPKKLPSRNWSIFLTLTAAFSAAVIYDKREKNRATARWAAAVAPLATEPVLDPSQMPRKLTVVLESPPGEGLRVAQDHFLEYVKPVLAASGLDWDFVQGRQQGDVRAAVAEKIRRRRKLVERPDEELLPTEENLADAVRRKNGTPEYDGIGGDIVVGRNAWKEYIRGLHEGWLGPLDAPAPPAPPAPEVSSSSSPSPSTTGEANSGAEDAASEGKEGEKEETTKPEEEEKKPSRPPQPIPHNSPDDYSSSHLPPTIPAHFSPSAPVQYPHTLGFLRTLTRLRWFLNRRALADDIGREVAAVCLSANRDWREGLPEEAAASGADNNDDDNSPQQHHRQPYEQQRALAWEEKNWIKSVWEQEKEDESAEDPAEKPKEKIWPRAVVVDPRIAERMRRFEITPEDEARARAIAVPEEQVEGWIKGSLRSLGRWGMSAFESKPRGPNVGNVDDEVV